MKQIRFVTFFLFFLITKIEAQEFYCHDWFYQNSITNIYSVTDCSEEFFVTYDLDSIANQISHQSYCVGISPDTSIFLYHVLNKQFMGFYTIYSHQNKTTHKVFDDTWILSENRMRMSVASNDEIIFVVQDSLFWVEAHTGEVLDSFAIPRKNRNFYKNTGGTWSRGKFYVANQKFDLYGPDSLFFYEVNFKNTDYSRLILKLETEAKHPPEIRSFNSYEAQDICSFNSPDCDESYIHFYLHHQLNHAPNIPYASDSVRWYRFDPRLKTLELTCENYYPVRTADERGMPYRGIAHPSEGLGRDCVFEIDLDLDDSKGVEDWIYRAGRYCKNDSLNITDRDVQIRSIKESIDSIEIKLQANFSNAPVPDGDNETLTVLQTQNIIIDNPGNTHLILINNGNAEIQDFETALSNVVYTNASDTPTIGSRKVSIEMFSGRLISDTVWVDFSVEESPDFSLGQNFSICPGDSILIAPDQIYTSMIWQDESNDQSLLITTPGLYWLEQENTVGCSYRDTLLVSPEEFSFIDLGPEQVLCFDQSILLDAGVHDEYIWSTGENTQAIEVSNAGLYSVTVSNAILCDFADSVRLYSSDWEIVELEMILPACTNTMDGEIKVITDFDDPDELAFFVNDLELEESNFDELGSGYYYLEIFDPLGCSQDTLLLLPPVDSFRFIIQPDTIIWGSNNTLEYEANTSVERMTINNNFSLSFEPTNLALTHGIPGWNVIQAESQNGCMIQDSIFIIYEPGEQLFIPNIFSPNDDGINDRLIVIPPKNGALLKLTIFSRWGDLVYEWTGSETQGVEYWDGLIDGKKASSAVYPIVVEYISNGNSIKEVVDLTLIR